MHEMVRQDDPYAIAVLDMCMPDVSGLELAQEISGDDELSSTQMIMLTSTSELDPADLSAAGVAEWLLKPVRTTDLYDRLLRLKAPQARIHASSAATAPSHPATADGDPATAVESLGRVLVVEDNPLNQLVAQGIVESIGYSVDIVANGAEALLAVLNTSYAAVLMDCHMPVLDGFEATQEMRRREGDGKRMPIIAMTAGAMAEDRARCVAAGMDGFVSKPVTLAAVESALAHWIHPSHDIPLLPESTPVPTLPDGRGQASWGDQPALDLNRIAQLRQLGTMGGTDLLGRVTTLFLRDGKTSLAAVRQASTADRVGDLRHELHKLKGTASNLGAGRVAALCARLEQETTDEPTAEPVQAPGPLLTPHQLEELELDRADQAIREAV
jgi:CheY-like chemotaxis protein/HPt (histidine-containing phosphotransfer) domain-containing protein